VIVALGRFTPALRAAILPSFHLVMRPLKMSASTSPVSFRARVSTPCRLNTGTTPPITVGNWRKPSFWSSSPLSGASVAPKSTVLARIWRMPPDEPIDW
jgi:hypothetical protein